MEFINASTVPVNTVHANTLEFYEELDHVIQKEPIGFIDPELRGLAAAIGIRKGSPFGPDQRMKRILTDAVAVGNATARAISFRNCNPLNTNHPGSQWKTLFGGADYQWPDDGGTGGRKLDGRTLFYYGYTVNTPAMVAKLVGAGSQYAMALADAAGNPFDGAKTYRMKVPANAPAKNFWSVVLYDPQTRSQLQTGQPFPSKNDKRNTDIAVNADGSVDLYFGPAAPRARRPTGSRRFPASH